MMISRLIGKPLIEGSTATILVGGVGYAVQFPPSLLHKLAYLLEVEVYVHTHIRQDALELFGFLDLETRQLFELLLSVSGVGPKTALQIVDLGPEKFIHAVQQADVASFSQVPRVGKKLAQKIIIELRGKLGELQELNLTPLDIRQQEVMEALVGLGFAEHDVEPLLRERDLSSVSLETSVMSLVQELGKKRAKV